jgi:hypothetical protein
MTGRGGAFEAFGPKEDAENHAAGGLARALLDPSPGKTPSAVKMTPIPEKKDPVLWR